MTTPSNVVSESQAGTQAAAVPAVFAGARLFLWSIRRELWEYRIVYLTPLIAAVIFLFSFLIHIINLRRNIHSVASTHETFAVPYELSGALIMGTALVVGLYYSLDCLYGERRDRSILFWKSLPVSDLTAVLSKLTIPLVFIPLFSFAVTIVTQFLMLLLSSLVLLGSGVSTSELWVHSSFLMFSLILLYHMLLVHGLWYAPIYGWMLLMSAWSPRAPVVWAILPPFIICGVEKLSLNTTYFLHFIAQRFMGPDSQPSMSASMSANQHHHFASQLIPHHFFTEPGLWFGLVVAAIFVAATVRLRRYRGPI